MELITRQLLSRTDRVPSLGESWLASRGQVCAKWDLGQGRVLGAAPTPTPDLGSRMRWEGKDDHLAAACCSACPLEGGH